MELAPELSGIKNSVPLAPPALPLAPSIRTVTCSREVVPSLTRPTRLVASSSQAHDNRLHGSPYVNDEAWNNIDILSHH
jgi:hypothetical protein